MVVIHINIYVYIYIYVCIIYGQTFESKYILSDSKCGVEFPQIF